MSPEERTRQDLEQDRKDAERELQHYEEDGIFGVTAEHTADIVRFWEVWALLFNLKIFLETFSR
jgi:outer membrane biogenesis lipoprotein LolB